MIKIQLELSQADFNKLWNAAPGAGFKRIDPRKAWTEREKKEAVRWAIRRLALLSEPESEQ